MKPEILYDLIEDDYHAHPALSSSGARKLLPPSCPAKFEWERRNPRPPTKAQTEGRAAHRLILGIGADIVPVVGFADWRTKAAKQARDEIEAAGSIALLEKDVRPLLDMRAALTSHPLFGRLFDVDRGSPEASIFWTDEETQVECRARLDFLPNPVQGRRLVVPDYKRSRSADRSGFSRSAADYGYPMQADWYLRAIKAAGLDPEPAFVFVVQEPEPPHVVTVGQFSRQDMQLAHERNRRALHTFAACSAAGHWPGYVDDVTTFEMPTYWRIESEQLTEESA